MTFSGAEPGPSAACTVVGFLLPIGFAGAHLLKDLPSIVRNAVGKERSMRTLSSIAEHQMVGAFLLAERTSPDFGPGVEHFQSRLGIPEPDIAQPDLSSVLQNGQRARVLGYRSYGRGEAPFAGFPDRPRLVLGGESLWKLWAGSHAGSTERGA